MKIRKFQFGNVVFPYNQSELEQRAYRSKANALHMINNGGETLDEYESGQRKRRLASGASAIGGLIQYEAPYIGAALQIPDLIYDGIDFVKSKDKREATKNLIHLGLDLPIIGSLQNANLSWKWAKSIEKGLKKAHVDETATAAGIIDDVEGYRGNDAIETIISNLNTYSDKPYNKQIEQPNSTFVRKPMIINKN